MIFCIYLCALLSEKKLGIQHTLCFPSAALLIFELGTSCFVVSVTDGWGQEDVWVLGFEQHQPEMQAKKIPCDTL